MAVGHCRQQLRHTRKRRRNTLTWPVFLQPVKGNLQRVITGRVGSESDLLRGHELYFEAI